MASFFGGILPTLINYSTYKRKLLEFYPTQEQENLVGKLLKIWKL
jgi:hypothetical protein